MHEFVLSITISILSASSDIPEVEYSGIDLARTGEKVIIINVNSSDPYNTTADVKTVVLRRVYDISVEEQRAVNDAGYLS